MIEGSTDTIRILGYISLKLKLLIESIITISKIILKSLLGISWDTVIGYIHRKVLIGKTWCIVLLISFLIDCLNPILRQLMYITIHLVMYIGILILKL